MTVLTAECLEQNLLKIFPNLVAKKIVEYFWFTCSCGCEHEWICNLTEFCNDKVQCYMIGVHPPNQVEFYVDQDNKELIEKLKNHKTFIQMKRDMPSGYRFWMMRMEFSVTPQRFQKYLLPEYWYQGRMRGVNIHLW